MAKLKKEILGKVSGSLGELTFRQRDGKSYISTRPDSFMPGTDEASKTRRAKFALSIKFARVIYSVPQLKSLWVNETPAGIAPFNHLMRSNYRVIGTPASLNTIAMAPSFGFDISNPSSAVNASDLTINVEALGTASGIIIAEEVSLQLLTILYLNDRLDESVEEYMMLNFSSAPIAVNLDDPLTFTIPVPAIKQQYISKYSGSALFSLLVTLDSEGEVVRYSNTF